ncbi:MAG TPA: GNAT family N-acetyltransferase [Candidatus Kapabacteria bacterium]|nr:GNAT family N-acetyltransferase [Candidatus Kapabacteria bacterium]
MLRLSEEPFTSPFTSIEEYLRVPISFTIERVLDVSAGIDYINSGNFMERTCEHPYEKNYDLIDSPLNWSKTFDVTNWGMIVARDDDRGNNDRIIGGAIVAFKCDTCIMLEGRDDLSVLWDIRVSPEYRRQGIGAMLFHAAETWARSRQCRELKVETQNINVPACRFYWHMGCKLGKVNHPAYPGLPDEIQLLWYKNIS